VRLVGPNGEQVGIVAINDALRLAQEADLDLVEVAPTARPPVAKLMDYGKFKYESALKARESRKHQAQTVIKEIKLRPKIDPHDYGTKKGHVERFLRQGDKVKVTIMFRGREQSRPDLGYRLLQRLAGDVEELGFVEAAPKQDGRNMIMVIGPHKRKQDSRAERPAAPQSAPRAAAPSSPAAAPSSPATAPSSPAAAPTAASGPAAAPSSPAAAPAAPSSPAAAPSSPATAPSSPATAPSSPATAPSSPATAPSSPAAAPTAPSSPAAAPAAPSSPAAAPTAPSGPAAAPTSPAAAPSRPAGRPVPSPRGPRPTRPAQQVAAAGSGDPADAQTGS
jgi:translation initiation factor IF-3